jgi:hypothetical protein
MPCQHFQDAIVEVAASGAEPQGELRLHLNACDDCRDAFVAERSLFRTIDAGLHTVANTEVPASFVLHASRRVAEEGLSSRVWRLSWAVAAAFAVCAVLLVAQLPRFFGPRGSKDSPISIPELSPPTAEASKQLSPMLEGELLSERTVHRKRRASVKLPPNVETPEVLVPPQEELALAQYVALLRKRTIMEQTLSVKEVITVEPIEIAEIDLGQLSIPFVQSEETGSSN